jgi:cytochrome c-type biogenesis protein CcmE
MWVDGVRFLGFMSDDALPVPEETPSNPSLEVAPRRRRARDEDAGQGSRRGLLVVLPLVMAGAAISALVLLGMQDQGLYSKPVDELVKNKARFAGRAVIAEGNLVHGSLEKRDQPCEYRFVLEKNGTEMPVRFPQCVVPDTFRDVPGMDVGVTVEGQLTAESTFEATKVIAKCPSKYKDKMQQGEKMPHAEIEARPVK